VITQWQTNTTGDAAGATPTLVVLRPGASGTATVVGTDTETIPSPLPAGGVATFNLPQPIAVGAGDALALYGSRNAICYSSGISTPSKDTVIAYPFSSAPTAGQTLSSSGGGGSSPPRTTLNVAAAVVQGEDAGVTTSASSGTLAGGQAPLSSTVTNAGPLSGPITFTDNVPAGLTVTAAVAGQGTCTVSGQQVTCTVGGLNPGTSVPVDIVVVVASAGSFGNSVAVSTARPDPNASNNAATATLVVAAVPVVNPVVSSPSAPKCVVPNLRSTPKPIATRVLTLLGCKVGRTRSVHDRRVPRGDVIRTAPGAGTYAHGRTVGLKVSSGPPKKVKKRHAHTR